MTEIEKLNKELYDLIQEFAVKNKLEIVAYTAISIESTAITSSILNCKEWVLVPAQSGIRLRMEKDYVTYVAKDLKEGQILEI